MANDFDNKRRRKAFFYTSIICSVLLLAFILISWSVMPPTVPVVQDLIEINLGNNEEGYGDKQPLKKGEPSPDNEAAKQEQNMEAASVPSSNENKIVPDENASKDAAAIEKKVVKSNEKKTEVTNSKTKPISTPAKSTPINNPIPKPKNPKATMGGGTSKVGGNNATEDNYEKSNGQTKGKKGDEGVINGNKDSYGNKVGKGKVGGPKVINGNRKVIRYYSFTGQLNKAIINAVIKVSPEGIGTFLRIGQGSTSTNNAYANDIRGFLQTMKFDKAEEESIVTVQFNFNVE